MSAPPVDGSDLQSGLTQDYYPDMPPNQQGAPPLIPGDFPQNSETNAAQSSGTNDGMFVGVANEKINGEEDPQTASSSQDDATSSEDVVSEYSSEPVKLFVGQVPKTMEEHDLFPLFEKFGPMEDVVIIRDKQTGQHRGCAFVTFINKSSADYCESEYHNLLVLPGGRRPLQIRPAGRREEENKVFVGMLPRDVTEDIIRELFSPFGEITGVYMIRNNDGIKKGCAFVKYLHRESAMSAIENMDGDMSLEDAQRPLIVKFADTKGQKKARQQTMHTRHDNGSYAGPPSPISHASMSQATSQGYIYHNMPPPAMHHIYPGPGPASVGPHSTGSVQYPPDGHYHAGGYHESSPPNGSNNFMYPQVNPFGAPSFDNSHQYMPPPQQPQDMSRGGGRVLRPTPQRFHQRASNPRPREGPAGANLFIYHLPHDLTDADLATAFNPFGNVISAKVYVDKFTGESKGFGFVSYDSVISAEQAIEQMNGFQIGSKRLKVQHKRVGHRPPMASSQMQNQQQPISYYQQELMYPQVGQDIPPSIEISSAGEDGETTGQTSSSQSTPHNDMDVLTHQFGGLQAGEQNGVYEGA